MTTRIVVLASGNGSNLQAIIDACEIGALRAQVVGVVSDNPQAFALQRATNHSITTKIVESSENNRAAFSINLTSVVNALQPDLVVLAGFMRILSNDFISHFPNKIINLHPALPGELPGANAIARAFDEYAAGIRSHTGVMVHYVPDEGVDNGPVIATTIVAINASDTLGDLKQRIHAAEHKILISAISQLTKEHTA